MLLVIMTKTGQKIELVATTEIIERINQLFESQTNGFLKFNDVTIIINDVKVEADIGIHQSDIEYYQILKKLSDPISYNSINVHSNSNFG